MSETHHLESDLSLAAKLIALDASAAATVIGQHRAQQRGARLRAVRDQWHNTPAGRNWLAAIATTAIGAVLVLFVAVSPRSFDAISKAATLFFTTVAALALLKEDPFHADLGYEATYLERLKGHGKLVAIFFTIGFLFGLLGLCAAARAQKQEREGIEHTARYTTEGLRRLNGELDVSLDRVTRLTLDMANLQKQIDTSVITQLSELPRKQDLVMRTELLARLDSLLPTHALVDTLKNSPWGKSLVTVNALPATLRDSDWGKSLVTVSALPATLRDSDWGKSLVTVSALPATIRDSDWGKSLVTISALSATLRDSDWGKSLVTVSALPATLRDSDWGKSLVTVSALPATLRDSDWGKSLVTTASLPALSQQLAAALQDSAWGKALVKAADLEHVVQRVATGAGSNSGSGP